MLNGYFYKVSTPITLKAGSTYFIGALHSAGAGGGYRHNTNVATVPSYINDLGSWYKVSGTIGGGNWASSGARHYVGNFQAHIDK